MARTASDFVTRQLESLWGGASVAGLSDRQLLERFVSARDSAGELAFAALVAHHGAMVLHICRQLLRDQHHAEDAFQAVFLVLARRAPSIRDPDLLGNWLYGVALRTALREASARSPPQERGGQYEWSRSELECPGRTDRRAGPGPRAGRDAPSRNRPTAELIPIAGCALLL